MTELQLIVIGDHNIYMKVKIKQLNLIRNLLI